MSMRSSEKKRGWRKRVDQKANPASFILLQDLLDRDTYRLGGDAISHDH